MKLNGLKKICAVLAFQLFVILGFTIIFLPAVMADMCSDGTTLIKESNITLNSNETINISTSKVCPYGCNVLLKACNTAFFIPIEFYLFFECMSLVLLFYSIFLVFGKQKRQQKKSLLQGGMVQDEVLPIPFIPLICMFIFFVLSTGTIYMFLVYFNWAFASISFLMFIYYFFVTLKSNLEDSVNKI